MGKSAYRNSDRLADIIFLIQYLGLGKNYSLRRDRKPGNIVANPRSDKCWVSIAQAHPEFFFVTSNKSVTLSLRYFLRNPGEKPPPLKVDDVQKLIANAVALQEQQTKKAEAWKMWGTFIAATVAAISGIAQLFFHTK